MRLRSSPFRTSRPSGPSRPRWVSVLPALVCAPWLLAAAAAAAQPTVTFVEGDSTLLSGGRAFVPSAGVRLRSCDALRTGPTAMVQVEFGDGTAVLLGPDTRFVFDVPAHAAALQGAQGAQFLHSGWAKVTAPKRTNAVPQLIETLGVDLSIDAGVAVLRMAPAVTQVYVELGTATAVEGSTQPPGRVTVRAGFTYTRKPDQPVGALTRGAEPELAHALPRTLRDTLPMRLAKLTDRDVRPRPSSAATDAEGWLGSSPKLRACTGGGDEDGIRRAQEILSHKGFDVGPIDGVLGARTAAALRAFQQQVGLPPSGLLDAETRRALEEAALR